MREEILYPFKVAEVFVYDLQAGLAHAVPRQVHSADSFDSQQYFYFFCAFFTESITTEIDHFKTTHIDNSA